MSTETADVVVVGAGLVGAAIAWRLARAGLRVVLLERASEPGAESSSAAAGILAPSAEELEARALFRLAAASLDAYPDFVAELADETGLAIDLRLDGVVHVATSPSERSELEARARRHAEANRAVERLDRDGLDAVEPGLGAPQSGLFVPGEGRVDARRLAQAAVEAAVRAGAELRRGEPALRIRREGARVVGVVGARAAFRSPVVVDAAGAWAALDPDLPFPIPVEPVRGVLLGLETARRPRHVVLRGSRYLVPRADGRVLVGSTMERCGYDKRVTAEAVRALIDEAIAILPSLAEARFDTAWAGLRPCTPDGMPILGATPIEGLYLATGHCRSGILLAPVTASLLARLVRGERTDVDLAPFSVLRFHVV